MRCPLPSPPLLDAKNDKKIRLVAPQGRCRLKRWALTLPKRTSSRAAFSSSSRTLLSRASRASRSSRSARSQASRASRSAHSRSSRSRCSCSHRSRFRRMRSLNLSESNSSESLGDSASSASSNPLRLGSDDIVLVGRDARLRSHAFKYPPTLGSEFLGSGRRVPTPTLGCQGFQPKRGILSQTVFSAFP